MATQEEQAFIAARERVQELVAHLKETGAVYRETKRAVIEAWLHDRYPERRFTVTMLEAKPATLEEAHFEFGIDIACHDSTGAQAMAILQEVWDYLSTLANPPQISYSITQQNML